jgi:hypothetical protein
MSWNLKRKKLALLLQIYLFMEIIGFEEAMIDYSPYEQGKRFGYAKEI